MKSYKLIAKNSKKRDYNLSNSSTKITFVKMEMEIEAKNDKSTKSIIIISKKKILCNTILLEMAFTICVTHNFF